MILWGTINADGGAGVNSGGGGGGGLIFIATPHLSANPGSKLQARGGASGGKGGGGGGGGVVHVIAPNADFETLTGIADVQGGAGSVDSAFEGGGAGGALGGDGGQSSVTTDLPGNASEPGGDGFVKVTTVPNPETFVFRP